MATDTASWWLALGSQVFGTICCCIFVRYRHRFPVADRDPVLTTTGILPLTLLNLTPLVDNGRSRDLSCSPLQSFNTSLMLPLAIGSFAVRAWRLLFLFQTTNDLQIANHTRASHTITIRHQVRASGGSHHEPSSNQSTSPHLVGMDPPSTSSLAAIQLSWYSRHRHWMKWRWLLLRMYLPLITGGLFIWIASMVDAGSTPCKDVSQFWPIVQLLWCLVLVLCIAIAIMVITCKLSRFGRDSLGLKFEMSAVGLLVIVCIFVELPLALQYGSNGLTGEAWAIIVVLNGMAVYFLTFTYPLILAYRHWRRSQGLANDVQRVVKLSTFLEIPQAAQAFAAFLAKEFSVEGFSFYQRCKEFKLKGNAALAQLRNNTNHHGHGLGHGLLAALSPFSPPSATSPVNHTTTPHGNHSGEHDRLLLSIPSPAAAAATSAVASANSPHGTTASLPSPAHAATAIGTMSVKFRHHQSSPGAGGKNAATVALSSPAAIYLREAYAIHQSFIVSGSVYEINVSSKLRKSITVKLQHMATAVAAATRHHLQSHATAGGGSGASAGGSPQQQPILLTARGTSTSPKHGGNSNSSHREADALLLQSILSIFDDAMEETLKLLQQHSFKRFRSSREYLTLIASIQNMDNGTTANGLANTEVGAISPGGGAASDPPSNEVIHLQSPHGHSHHGTSPIAISPRRTTYSHGMLSSMINAAGGGTANNASGAYAMPPSPAAAAAANATVGVGIGVGLRASAQQAWNPPPSPQPLGRPPSFTRAISQATSPSNRRQTMPAKLHPSQASLWKVNASTNNNGSGPSTNPTISVTAPPIPLLSFPLNAPGATVPASSRSPPPTGALSSNTPSTNGASSNGGGSSGVMSTTTSHILPATTTASPTPRVSDTTRTTITTTATATATTANNNTSGAVVGTPPSMVALSSTASPPRHAVTIGGSTRMSTIPATMSVSTATASSPVTPFLHHAPSSGVAPATHDLT